jgi:hypothetical protein
MSSWTGLAQSSTKMRSISTLRNGFGRPSALDFQGFPNSIPKRNGSGALGLVSGIGFHNCGAPLHTFGTGLLWGALVLT